MFAEIIPLTGLSLKKKGYKLSTVANALGMHKARLVELFRAQGFVSVSYDQDLTLAHMNVLSRLYINSVRKQFKKLLATRSKLGPYTDAAFASYAHFTSSNWNGEIDPSRWNLEDELIEEQLYRMISSADRHERNLLEQYRSILVYMFRVAKTVPGHARSALLHIIPPKLFFTYADEDHTSTAAIQPGFAVAGN